MVAPIRPIVILSYSAKDRDSQIMRDLVTLIRTLPVDLRIDEEILLPSNQISESLREEIVRSQAVVWLLTENSLNSKWCPVEVGAFWGAGKPVIIYNPFGIEYEGPFRDIKQARTLEDIKRALTGLEVRSKTLASVTIEEASQIMEKGLNSIADSLSDELSMFSQHLPILRHLAKYLEMQNLFLSNHAEVLTEITKMVEQAPKRLRCAFDVPSFGSISAEREYRICCDAFDTYVAREEWCLSIMLLPADVGVNIVNTEFKGLQKRRQAWVEDIHALHRFQGYEQRAGQRGKRKFKLGWLAVNRDANGMPLGLHAMPFNLWIANEEQAVFSTVIDNYRPTSTNLADTAGSQVQEIGFSTRNPDMVRFLIEIMQKYSQNVDEGVTLEAQIAASEAVKAKIERSIEKGMS